MFEANKYVGKGQRAALAAAVVAGGVVAGWGTDYMKSVLSGDVKLGDSRSFDKWWSDPYTHIGAVTYGVGFGVMNDAISSVGSSLLRDLDLANELGEATGDVLVSPAIQAGADLAMALYETGEAGVEYARKGRMSNKQWKEFTNDWGDVRDDLTPKLFVVEQFILHALEDSRHSAKDFKKKLDKRQHRDGGAWLQRGLMSK